MKRATRFFAVDAVALALFLLLTSTGILVRYTLPPDSGHFRTVWGMDRHHWGQVHFWMAVGLFATMTIHIFFHWRWVVSMVKGRPRHDSGTRLGLALVGMLGLATLAAAPFFTPVEESGEPPHRLRATDRETVEEHDGLIKGSITVRRVEEVTGVPTHVILSELGLPTNTPPDELLGRLRRAHDFEIEDVRAIVRAHMRVQVPDR